MTVGGEYLWEKMKQGGRQWVGGEVVISNRVALVRRWHLIKGHEVILLILWALEKLRTEISPCCCSGEEPLAGVTQVDEWTENWQEGIGLPPPPALLSPSSPTLGRVYLGAAGKAATWFTDSHLQHPPAGCRRVALELTGNSWTLGTLTSSTVDVQTVSAHVTWLRSAEPRLEHKNLTPYVWSFSQAIKMLQIEKVLTSSQEVDKKWKPLPACPNLPF